MQQDYEAKLAAVHEQLQGAVESLKSLQEQQMLAAHAHAGHFGSLPPPLEAPSALCHDFTSSGPSSPSSAPCTLSASSSSAALHCPSPPVGSDSVAAGTPKPGLHHIDSPELPLLSDCLGTLARILEHSMAPGTSTIVNITVQNTGTKCVLRVSDSADASVSQLFPDSPSASKASGSPPPSKQSPDGSSAYEPEETLPRSLTIKQGEVSPASVYDGDVEGLHSGPVQSADTQDSRGAAWPRVQTERL